MTMADPPRLSRSMDNLADDAALYLNKTKSFSRSLDNLKDESLSQCSDDKASVELNGYFDDDNEEGEVEGSGDPAEFGKSDFDDDQNGYVKSEFDERSPLLEEDLRKERENGESGSGEAEPAEYADQSDTVSDGSVFESKSSKHDNIINSMLVLDDKETSVLLKNWEDLKIDKDIQVSVSEFCKGFFETYLNQACNDEKMLLVKTLHNGALKTEITKWLSAKLQIERDGWSLKLKMALKEIEDNRKSALKAAALTQDCSQQLRLLIECFNVSDSVLDSIPLRNSREAIQRSLELLVEICNALMEDRFQCIQMLELEDEGGLVCEALQEHLRTQDAKYRRHMEEATQQTRQAESENLKLLKEVVRMKKVLSQKQQDVEFLRKQMADINDVLVNKQVRRADKSTSTHPSNNDPVESSRVRQGKHQRPATETIPSVQKQVTNHRQRPATETQSSAQARESSIHISQEKLSQLKQRAKRLEDSLHDAIVSMDKLRKSTGPVTNNNNSAIPNDIEVSSLNHSQDEYEYVPKLTGLKKDWEKASFEIKAGLQVSPVIKKPLNPHKTIPKLNLKNSQRTQEKRSVSDRGPPREVFKEMELKKTAELSATLAQLKVFKPQAGKVSKCFRCQKLFRQIDNHKLACVFHPKSKERVEKYTGGGQLVKVVYIWTCCRQNLDSEGCTYGQHV